MHARTSRILFISLMQRLHDLQIRHVQLPISSDLLPDILEYGELANFHLIRQLR